MLLRFHGQFAIASLIALTGCAGMSRDHAQNAPATQPAAASGAATVMPKALRHSDVLQTSLSPADAATVAGNVFQQLYFHHTNGAGGFGGGGGGGFGQFTPSGDFFSAEVEAMSLHDEKIEVACEWMRVGATTVRFQSDLAADRHAFVLKELENALTIAATQPAAKEN